MTKRLIIVGLSVLGLLPFVSFAQTSGTAGAGVCISLQSNMTNGSTDATTNGEVSALQAYLYTSGYLSVAPTGYYGALTTAAVKQFQTANGISSIGITGPLTRGKIATLTCSDTSTTVSGGGTGSTVPGCVAGAAYSSTTGQSCSSAGGSASGGSAPTVVCTQGTAPATTGGSCPSNANNPTPALFGVQWHQDFRFTDPFGDDAAYQGNASHFAAGILAKLELDFNWLMQNYGSEYAFCFFQNVGPYKAPLNYSFLQAFAAYWPSDSAEAARVISTYANGTGGGGNAGPAGTIGANATCGASADVSTFSYAYGSHTATITLPYPTGTYTAPLPALTNPPPAPFSCSSTSGTNCTSTCPIGTALQNGLCVSTCPVGMQCPLTTTTSNSGSTIPSYSDLVKQILAAAGGNSTNSNSSATTPPSTTGTSCPAGTILANPATTASPTCVPIGGSSSMSCSGFNTPIQIPLTYEKGTYSQVTTTSVGATFGNQDLVQASFTTPSTLINGGIGGYLNVVEAGGASVQRSAVLTTTPCDLSYREPNNTNYSTNSVTVKILFNSDARYGVVLKPNTTYYFYVWNKTSTGAGTCSTGDCSAAVTLQAR